MGAGRRGAGREKLEFIGERGGEWGNFGKGNGDPACLVGEGWWVSHVSGREMVGNFGGVGGKIWC